MKQSQFYYLLRRGLLKSMSVVREGLVMFNKFTTAGISHPAQGSAEFDGSSDVIGLGTKSFITEDAFSVSFWQYANNTGEGYIFSTGYNNTDSLVFYNDGGSYLKLLYPGSGGTLTSNAVSMSANVWDHYTYTYDGTTLKIYKNGSEKVSQSFAITNVASGTYEIGWATPRNKSTAYFDGNLANVAIWNRALSSDEINAVMWKGYQSLTDNEKSGLQAWYSLDDVASPAASLATMEALAVDKDATIENKAAVTAAINALS